MDAPALDIDRTVLDRYLAHMPACALHSPASDYTCGFGDADFAQAVRISNDHLIPRSLTLYFRAAREPGPLAADAYLNGLLVALERTAALIAEDREVQHIAFAEGLPEWLGNQGVARLLDAVARHLRTTALPDVSVRLRPGSQAALRSLVAVGCTRATLLDSGDASAPSLLSLRDAVADAGFVATGHVLAGPPTPRRLRQVLEWRPDQIELAGCAECPVQRVPALLADAVCRLREAGYRQAGADVFMHRRDPLWRGQGKAPYVDLTGALRPERTDLIGLGAAAPSQLGDVSCQAFRDPVQWLAAIGAGWIGIERGLIQSPEEALNAEIVQSLACAYGLDERALAGCVPGVFPARYAAALARMQPLLNDGLARRDGPVLGLSPTGALLWRIFAACFQPSEFVA